MGPCRWVSRLLRRFIVFLRCYSSRIFRFREKGSVLAAYRRVVGLRTMVCSVQVRWKNIPVSSMAILRSKSAKRFSESTACLVMVV
ncbi:hypothetical protein D9M69_672120 [compost metagenome]